jgi:hypothetical protein
MNPGTSTPTHILSGWKDIANYLGKGVRTVQRYEADLRLPVRRPAGRSRGSVVATKAELDAWVVASPVREQTHVAMNANPASFLDGMRENLREMRILREEMRDLRSDMKRSVGLLHASIVELRGRVQEKSAAPLMYEMGQYLNGIRVLGGADDFVYPRAS